MQVHMLNYVIMAKCHVLDAVTPENPTSCLLRSLCSSADEAANFARRTSVSSRLNVFGAAA